MYYIYILKLKNDSLYIGFSKNIKERTLNHELGKSPYTSKFLPVKLIYSECYINKTDILAREKFLKSGRGREVIKKQLRNTLKRKS